MYYTPLTKEIQIGVLLKSTWMKGIEEDESPTFFSLYPRDVDFSSITQFHMTEPAGYLLLLVISYHYHLQDKKPTKNGLLIYGWHNNKSGI